MRLSTLLFSGYMVPISGRNGPIGSLQVNKMSDRQISVRRLDSVSLGDGTCSQELQDKVQRALSANSANLARTFIPENEKRLLACLSSGYNGKSVDDLMLESARNALVALSYLWGNESPAENEALSDIETRIDNLWAAVEEDEALLEKFVTMPNEAALRYIVGPREAVRYIMTAKPVSGLSVLLEWTDSDRTMRLLSPLSTLLDKPMVQLMKLSGKYSTEAPSSNFALSDPLMRPRNKPLMAFLVGKARAEFLSAEYTRFLQEYLSQKLQPKSLRSWVSERTKRNDRSFEEILNTYPRGRSTIVPQIAQTIESILSHHIDEFDSRYDIVSIENLDKLAAAIGSRSRAYEMVSGKAWKWILHIRSACEAARKMDPHHLCPIVHTTALWMQYPHQDLVVQIKRIIIDHLDIYPSIFSAGFDYLSFLIGPVHAAVLSGDGLNRELKLLSDVERDENNNKKVIETLTSFEALRPGKDRVSTVFKNLVDKELNRIKNETF